MKRLAQDRPLFRKLDNLLLRVADLDAPIALYRDRLGHRVLWRSEEAVGFALPDTDMELVIDLKIGPEAYVMVENVDESLPTFPGAARARLSWTTSGRPRAPAGADCGTNPN